MPAIRSNTDLVNNFNEIVEFCHNYREPVFLTNNGQGQLAVMSIADYEELTGKLKLYSLLAEGKNAIKNGKYVTEEEMDKILESM